MENSLSLKPTEIRCAAQIPELATWIIEYAWNHRMMDILEGLMPSMWQEGELHSLTLEEPCTLRVAAARAWSVVNARDVTHFDSVLELLETTYTLLPRLVTPIKHMKIMFGLKTMIIMCMLQKNQGEVRTMTKIIHFFPDKLSMYHECSKRDLDAMRKSHCEFKQLAKTLLFEKDVHQAYIREQMEEQYGEEYAQKLEERLFDYLQLLEGVLPPTTCIDRVMTQEQPLTEGEQALLEVLSCSSYCVPAVLRRLLHYAETAPCTHSGLRQRPRALTDKGEQRPHSLADLTRTQRQTAPPAEKARAVKPSTSQASWRGCDTPKPLCSRWPCEDGRGSGAEQRLRRQAPPPGQAPREERRRNQGEGQGQRRRTKLAEEHRQKEVSSVQLCSKHQRWVRNVLQECSEQLGGQSVSILKECPIVEQGQSVSILEECPIEEQGQSVSILKECPIEEQGQSVSILEECPIEKQGQSVSILEECLFEEQGQSVSILEECLIEKQGQSVSILEECPIEEQSQSVSILEECPIEKQGQSVSILEECPIEEQSQSVSIVEECPIEEQGQSLSILEECPIEKQGQSVSIVEECPIEEQGQSVSILEECPIEEQGQSVSILEECPVEGQGQSVSILMECPIEEQGQSVSILEECPIEEQSQSVSILEEFSTEPESWGAIQLQRVLPLALPHPMNPHHHYHNPRNYLGWGRDTAGCPDRMERGVLGVRISLESQLVLIQSQILQPSVQLRRLTQWECHQAMTRGTRILQEEREEEEEEEGDSLIISSPLWEMDFSYSEFDSEDSDPDYNPF